MTDQPNRWCVEGQYQVYSDEMILNDKGVMTQTLTLERWVLMGSLSMMPEIHNLFTRHRLERIARRLDVILKSWYEDSTRHTWLLSDQRLIGRMPNPNRPHWSMSEYVAFRLISSCLPSADFYTMRMLMLIGPLSQLSLTTDGRFLKMANSYMSHR